MNLFQKLLNFKEKKKYRPYANFFSNNTPIFSQFGKDITASDLVKDAIRAKATEISKVRLEHIVTNKETGITKVQNDSLEKLFKCSPNQLMTMTEFLEKIVWQYELKDNAFIYPTYIRNQYDNTKAFTGLYPLNPVQVDFIENTDGKLWVTLHFENGFETDLPYSEIIHIRKDYSLNEFMGGNYLGQVDNTDLLKILESNNKIIEGLGMSIESSLTMKGIIHAKTLLDGDKLTKEREKLENQLKNTKSGLIPIDLAVDVTPFDIDPVTIDSKVLNFIENRVCRRFEVSIPIMNGVYTEEEYQAFHQKSLQPFFKKLTEGFNKTLFTETQRNYGHEVRAFFSLIENASLNTKINFTELMSNLGTLTDNQILALFGYPPYEGGDIRKQSLNYINTNIADDYQLGKVSTENNKKEENKNEKKKKKSR